ncbi:hypothetical protein HAHE_23760 [Haloferula helveola]|uniref:EF-hand domain-containing protein n=1 Tax=Haloferula helveola TaxID=490095 RepID=A0ABM7RD82_9BACT|nr:hypothetical protein HAHE_23760 [Haloferula helveola]
MKTTVICSTLALLVAGSITASAQDGDKPKGPRGDRQLPPQILEKFDKDGDGKLNEEERKAAMEARKGQAEARRKEMLEKYDKDGDGKLSEEEREAVKADMKAKHEALLAKYDADKDGKLSAEERKAAIDAGEKLPPMRGPGGPGGKDRPGAKKPGKDGKPGKDAPKGPRKRPEGGDA